MKSSDFNFYIAHAIREIIECIEKQNTHVVEKSVHSGLAWREKRQKLAERLREAVAAFDGKS